MPSAAKSKVAAVDVNKPLFEAVDALSLKAIERALDQGADPNALYKGKPAIYHAAEHDYIKMITKLAKSGASVDALTSWGRTVLHFAAEKNKLEVAKCVLELGANANVLDETGRTALHHAVDAGAREMIALLAKHGADMNAGDESGRTALHFVATKEASVDIAGSLIQLGAAVDPVDMDSTTPLHDACSHGDAAILTFLVEHGANLEAVDSNGMSALHHAATDSGSEAASKALYLIERGVPVEIKDSNGRTALHHAAMTANISVAKALIEKRANPKAVDNNEITVLRQLILSDTSGQLPDVYAMAQLLCSGGAKLAPPPPAAKKSGFAPWQLGMRACVRHWQSQKEEGVAFTPVTIEVVQRGEAAVKNFLEDMKRAKMDQLRYRRKICVVGPSEWGKTSLVKSLTSEQPSLVHIDDRTIGIDLFAYAFDRVHEQQMEIEHHEVTFWDFAGQDVYQVAHALFFSPRTLYLVCVNLEVYAAAMEAAEGLSLSQAEASMNRFVSLNVLRWIRLIFTRQTDAQFAFVGTKVDRLKDPSISASVYRDLQARLFTWKRDLIAEIDEAHQQAGSNGSLPSSLVHKSGSRRSARRAELMAKLDAIVASEWIVVSSVNVQTVVHARDAIKEVVLKSDRSYMMPPTYTRVLEAIEKRREEAARLPDVRDRIEHTIVPFSALYSWLAREIENLEADAFVSILQMLHDVGDILWYEHVESSFKNVIILDPTLVIDYVREVVNHKLSDAEAIAEDGRLAHAVLSTIPFWRDSDEELMHAFKLLLQQFQLAHPADSKVMDWDSDLIVPAYWKVRRSESTDDLAHQAQQLMTSTSRTKSFVWEYAVAAELSETVFDHFAVHSYTPLFARSVWRNCIESSVPNEFVSRIELHQNNAVRDLIRMELTAVDGEVGWQCMRFFIMAMEEVLEDYPGLVVSRYIVDGYTDQGEKVRHRVGDAVSALQDAVAMGRSVDALRVLMPWIPPDLQWFVEKAWRVPGKLHEIQLRSNVRQVVDKTEVLAKLVVADSSRRRLPALWVTEYVHSGKDIVLRMLSDLSGECFHERIKIQLPHEFLASYCDYLQTGLAIYANVVADAISLGILRKAIDMVSSDASAKVEEAKSVRCVIENLDAQSFGGLDSSSASINVSPRTATSMLKDLLKCHDPAFDELCVGDLSNLECAVTTGGSYIWASRQEIMVLGDALTPCDPQDWHRDTEVQESAEAESNDGLNDMNVDQPVNATSVEKNDPVQLRLTLVGTRQLPAWDWRRVYCKWELIHLSSSSIVASGSTSQHSDDTTEPSWSSVGFTIMSGLESIQFLRECVLRVQLKRPSRCLGVVKLVSEGSLALDGVIESHGLFTMEVSLGSSLTKKHVLVCELDVRNFQVLL